MSELHVTANGPIDVGTPGAVTPAGEPVHVVSDAPAAAEPTAPRKGKANCPLCKGAGFIVRPSSPLATATSACPQCFPNG